MNKKEGLLFWVFIMVVATIAAAGGFIAAQYSVDSALAQQNPLYELESAGTGFTGGDARPPKDLRLVIFQIVQVVLGLIGTLLTVLILYAGYLWWSARGEEEKVKKAKATLRNALIGLIIVAMSYSLVTFVFNAIAEPHADIEIEITI